MVGFNIVISFNGLFRFFIILIFKLNKKKDHFEFQSGLFLIKLII